MAKIEALTDNLDAFLISKVSDLFKQWTNNGVFVLFVWRDDGCQSNNAYPVDEARILRALDVYFVAGYIGKVVVYNCVLVFKVDQIPVSVSEFLHLNLGDVDLMQ